MLSSAQRVWTTGRPRSGVRWAWRSRTPLYARASDAQGQLHEGSTYSGIARWLNAHRVSAWGLD
jgi:hypothetical protein